MVRGRACVSAAQVVTFDMPGSGMEGVVMGCDERLARSVLAHIRLAGGHVEMLGFAGVGLAGGDVVTQLSH
jgi:hypothetical protein